MKQLLATITIFSVSSLLFVSCDDKTTSSTTEEIRPTFDIAGAKKAIEAANADLSSFVAKSDSVSITNLYTSDAKLMPANMPAASGKSAIQTAFSQMFQLLGQFELRPTVVDVWGTEELLSEEGTYVMSKEGKEIDKGKYLALWKMEDGKWKMFRDCFNSDNPPPPSK